MGLISKKPITNTTLNYTIPTDYYFRIFAMQSICGKKIEIVFKEYLAKPANFAERFAAGELHNSVPLAFGSPGLFDYDRVINGIDVLAYAHYKAKQWLIETVKNEDGTAYFTDADIEIESIPNTSEGTVYEI